jgi:hypothetical protein
MSLRSLTMPALAALSLVGAAQARPLTTEPSYVLNIHVTITDTRIVVDPHSAPRGAEARFIIKNTGTKAHNFTLNGKTSPMGVRQKLSRTLEPHQRVIAQLFLDSRARVPYFNSLRADRGKPGMRGFFVIS